MLDSNQLALQKPAGVAAECAALLEFALLATPPRREMGMSTDFLGRAGLYDGM